MFKLGLINQKVDLRAVFLLALFTVWVIPTVQTLPLMTTEVPITSVTGPTPFDKLGQGVTGLLAQGPTPVNVIVETTTNDYSQIIPLIESLGGSVTIEYQFIDALAVTIPANALLDLAENPLVAKIYQDTPRYLQEDLSRIGPDEMLMAEDSEMTITPIDLATLDDIPGTHANPALTMADQIWADPDINGGDGVTIAIIDTGCWNDSWVDPDYGYTWYPWYNDSVYDGVDLSYDVGTSNEGYGNPQNHYHGTFVASQIAARVEITFGVDHLWGLSILEYNPAAGYIDATGHPHVFCYGIAPYAEIFAVKVFDHTGGGVPSSLVMEGMEAAMAEGVDIMSMSLGGGVGAPGEDPEDLLVDAATELGITVVVAAGNEGPAPLRVGSPGTAMTSITVGAAIDPIHHKVGGGIIYGDPYWGQFYYPRDEKAIAYFSSRGPTSDGRLKPDVVATGYWNLGGLTPSRWPYTISIGGGTSYSCPVVAGEAALLIAYNKNKGLGLGPAEIKEAITQGAEPIPGFSAIEQGAGYINCENSLAILQEMTIEDDCGCGWHWGHHRSCHWGHHWGTWWFPPIDTLRLRHGKVTVHDVTLNPAEFEYFAFEVGEQVDSVRITLSGVDFAPIEEQNPYFGDSGYIYLSSAIRDGIEDYLITSYYYDADPTAPETFIYQFFTDFTFQPGVLRLVFEEDWWSYNSISIEELTIEVFEVQAFKCWNWLYLWSSGARVDQAKVSVYDGSIHKETGQISDQESVVYGFTIPDATGFAIVELSWKRDWSRWATSDLDLIIFGPGGSVNVDGATGASPEAAVIAGAGDYWILIDGYQVYNDYGPERYKLRIIYFASFDPIWEKDFSAFWCGCCWQPIRIPRCLDGLAVIWLYDSLFDYWYIGDYLMV